MIFLLIDLRDYLHAHASLHKTDQISYIQQLSLNMFIESKLLELTYFQFQISLIAQKQWTVLFVDPITFHVDLTPGSPISLTLLEDEQELGRQNGATVHFHNISQIHIHIQGIIPGHYTVLPLSLTENGHGQIIVPL